MDAAEAFVPFVGPVRVPLMDDHWYVKFGPLLLPAPFKGTMLWVHVKRLGGETWATGAVIF